MSSADKTFLPGVGFRRAGVRLAGPVSADRGDRTLTVTQLVSTSEATDVVYEVTHLPGDMAPGSGSMEKVVLHDGSANYGLGGGMSVAVRTGKLVRTFAMVPLPSDVTRVELRVSGPSIGEWAVPLELVPFPSAAEERYVEVGASDSLHGLAVSVRGIVASRAMTALDLMVLADRPAVQVEGVGGLSGMRDASTALTLRDQTGRAYTEHFRQDARDQFPDPSGIADVAIFDPLSDDADELVLEVPTICFDDPEPSLEVDLPVAAPISAMFGDYRVRVLASREIEIARGLHRGQAVALDLDLGASHDNKRVLKPWQVKVDGQFGGYGYGGRGMYAPAPRPLDLIEIQQKGSEPPRRVTFSGATIEARGPWRVRFHRP